MEQQNRSTFNVQLKAQNKVLKENVQFIEGIIEGEHIDIDVTVESTECGLGIAYFYIEIEDGSPVSFSI